MSKNNVNDFFELADRNTSLRKKLFNASSPDIVIEIAKNEGYIISEVELIKVMQEKQLSFISEEELSDEALEIVVGGKGSKKVEDRYYTNDGTKIVKKG